MDDNNPVSVPVAPSDDEQTATPAPAEEQDPSTQEAQVPSEENK